MRVRRWLQARQQRRLCCRQQSVSDQCGARRERPLCLLERLRLVAGGAAALRSPVSAAQKKTLRLASVCSCATQTRQLSTGSVSARPTTRTPTATVPSCSRGFARLVDPCATGVCVPTTPKCPKEAPYDATLDACVCASGTYSANTRQCEPKGVCFFLAACCDCRATPDLPPAPDCPLGQELNDADECVCKRGLLINGSDCVEPCAELNGCSGGGDCVDDERCDCDETFVAHATWGCAPPPVTFGAPKRPLPKSDAPTDCCRVQTATTPTSWRTRSP